MAVPPMLLLLVAVVTTCNCVRANSYSPNSGTTASQFSAILKPPPPPHLSPIVPVPFHRGPSANTLDNNQLQNLENLDAGYHYQLPPSPAPPPIKLSNDFKFPAPFYRQYNFNFVPPPQPFTTTPSPSMFQKVSGWLFPSQQTSHAGSTVFNNNNVAPIKKDCNPCNLVPWLPVIRYNVGNKNVYQSSLPTYGPPSPTAYADSFKVAQQHPEPFQLQNDDRRLPQLSPSLPHKTYGSPSYNTENIRIVSSTYGPPSATHTLDVSSQNPPSSTISQPSSSYAVPSSSYGLPSSQVNQHSIRSLYNQPGLSLSQPSLQFDQPNLPLNQPSLLLNEYSSSYISTPVQEVPRIISNVAGTTYSPFSSSYGTPSPSYGTPYPVTTTFQPVTPHYDPGALNKELPQESDVDILSNVDPIRELQLPKVSYPTSFKNSYGVPITNTNVFEIPYPASSTGAESSKIKTHVLPHSVAKQPNMSFALANPAPFTMNRGRNIHTLQPVALPNLSVSPLPPIFNARPFRPVPPQFATNVFQGINQMQQPGNKVNVEQSISLAEFTHSVDYPPTVIQSPVIEIDATRNFNQSKGYRYIQNSFITDDIRDITSQASEDHISATKSVPDSSFESTGVDNDLYDTGAPSDLKPISQVPPNHKPGFADLRGVKDEDVDKYRTESNLQNIDSPLLYLKPSAPHKSYGNFVLAISSPIPDNEYAMYDDVPTTASPHLHTHTADESRSDYNDEISLPAEQQNVYQPKIVQIIVPYTTGNKPENDNINDFVQMQLDANSKSKEEYQPRKVPSNTDNSYVSTVTENYSTISTTTEETLPTVTEYYDSDRLSSSGNKDHYDVKEPPFDIIKLQHTIDDWTEQEYSKQYKTPQRTRSSEKYSKQIPDEYFTTTIPTNFVTATNNYNYEFYDHEGSSSIQHSITDEVNNTSKRPRNEYNVIERTKNRHSSSKNEELEEVQRLHIYTAASSFRTTTTTTPAPWGKIQTSISPLTKEKVYVVTSKPWRGNRNVSSEWYAVDAFESKKTNTDHESSGSRNLPFKSPRFMTRPSFGFTSGGKVESVKSDSSYGFSRSWYQSINELESHVETNSTSNPGETQLNDSTNLDEDTDGTTAV